MMARFILSPRAWLSLLALGAILKILSEVYFTKRWVLTAVKTVAIHVPSTAQNSDWTSGSERTRDGTYELNFRYRLDPHLRVARYATFPLDLIHKKGGSGNISYAEMAQINDTDWKRPIHPDVFLLYPQGLALPEVIRNYRQTGSVPEIPINSPAIKLLKVSTSVCPPEGGSVDGPEHPHDLVVIVKSAVYNFEDRQTLRRLYANLRNASSEFQYRIGVVFVVGLPTSSRGNLFQRDGFSVYLPGRAGNSLVNNGRRPAQIWTRLQEEMRQHDDLIVGDFEDTYYNLSLKMQHTFVWAARFCHSGRPGFLFLDDDFAFNGTSLLAALARLPADWRRTVSISNTRWNSPTVRPGDSPAFRKWALTKREIPWPMHAPHINGHFYMLGYDHVADLALAMFFTKRIPIDDVWLGLVMHRLGLHFHLPAGIAYSSVERKDVSGFIVSPLGSFLRAAMQNQAV
ncbi:hypothetical protein SprV_0702330000 [Sparganum proliferum]